MKKIGVSLFIVATLAAASALWGMALEANAAEAQVRYTLDFRIVDKNGEPIDWFEDGSSQYKTSDGYIVLEDTAHNGTFDPVGTHEYGFEYSATSSSINGDFRTSDTPYMCVSDHDSEHNILTENTVVTFTCHGIYFFQQMYLTPEGIKLANIFSSHVVDPKPGTENGMDALQFVIDAQNDGLFDDEDFSGISRRWDAEGTTLGADWIPQTYREAFPDGVNYEDMSLLWGDGRIEPGKYIYYVFLADGLTVDQLKEILNTDNAGLVSYLYNNISDRIRVYGVVETENPLRRVRMVNDIGVNGEPAEFVEADDENPGGGDTGATVGGEDVENPDGGDAGATVGGEDVENPKTVDVASSLIVCGMAALLMSVLIIRVSMTRRE